MWIHKEKKIMMIQMKRNKTNRIIHCRYKSYILMMIKLEQEARKKRPLQTIEKKYCPFI